jgi:hypothetical protein
VPGKRRSVKVPERTAAEPQPIRRIRPHPDVWAEGLRIAGGDPRRLRVLSEHEILVTNHPVR